MNIIFLINLLNHGDGICSEKLRYLLFDMLFAFAIQKRYTIKYIGGEKMGTTTHQVNFRTESSLYKQAKSTLDNDKVSVSEILNATLRKIATGAIDPVEFISSDTVNNDTFRTAFEDLKKEILVGHQAILKGNTTSLTDVRKEFNLD